MKETFYWLFSASAQAIPTFIGLLIAVYALVLSTMERLQERDDASERLYGQLKISFYNIMVLLLLLVGISILLSLTMVYLFGTEYSELVPLGVVTSLVNVSTVILGICFILKLLDPDTIKKVASKIISSSFPFDGKRTTKDRAVFAETFIEIERQIRMLIERKGEVSPRNDLPFERMIAGLQNAGFIHRDLYNKLIDLQQYRNLVFHGHLPVVDGEMVENVMAALKEIKTISEMFHTIEGKICPVHDENSVILMLVNKEAGTLYQCSSTPPCILGLGIEERYLQVLYTAQKESPVGKKFLLSNLKSPV